MSEDSLKTRQTLLLRIRDEGDVRAWAEFMNLYAAFVFNYCRKQALQTADTEDVVQEVFRTVAKSIRGFDYAPSQGTFRAWLFRVVRSKLANHFNKRKRHPTIPGKTLEQVMQYRGEPLSIDEISRIIRQVASGLAVAHDRGLIHRDIKPENLLLETATDRVWIADFGLARAVWDPSLTRSGSLTGPPLFMSP